MERMSPLDALFLHAEDGISHMHIGSCARFDGRPPTTAEWRDLVAAKLHLVPRFRQKVRFVPGGLGRPVWVDDASFDLDTHLRRTALPAPGSETQLSQLMGRLMSNELDRDRPLWEMWLVEGLERGEWAIISKVHHCMVDGISGTDLMTSLLDREPDAVPGVPSTWIPAPEPSDLRLTIDALQEMTTTPVRWLASSARQLVDPRRTWERLGAYVEGARSFGRRILAPDPSLSVEGTIGRQRRWAVARCSLADVQTIRQALGGSVNDVVLTAITAGFRELLLHRGEQPGDVGLTSLVPVSVRPPGDRTHNNQVSMMIAELPIGIADPIERLHAVRAHLRELKRSHQADAGAAAFDVASLVPPPLFAAGAHAAMAVMRHAPQHTINTVTTNVPGPAFPLYLLGREMLEYAPFVPLSEGIRIGVAILSYNGRISFGVTGDMATAPDVDLLAERIDAAMCELHQLAADRAAAPVTRS